MQTSGTTDQSTRFPVVSGASGSVASAFFLLMSWIGELFRREEEDGGER